MPIHIDYRCEKVLDGWQSGSIATVLTAKRGKSKQSLRITKTVGLKDLSRKRVLDGWQSGRMRRS